MTQAHSLLDVDAVISLTVRLRAITERMLRAGVRGADRARWNDEIVRISGLGSVDPARASMALTELEHELEAILARRADDGR